MDQLHAPNVNIIDWFIFILYWIGKCLLNRFLHADSVIETAKEALQGMDLNTIETRWEIAKNTILSASSNKRSVTDPIVGAEIRQWLMVI